MFDEIEAGPSRAEEADTGEVDAAKKLAGASSVGAVIKLAVASGVGDVTRPAVASRVDDVSTSFGSAVINTSLQVLLETGLSDVANLTEIDSTGKLSSLLVVFVMSMSILRHVLSTYTLRITPVKMVPQSYLKSIARVSNYYTISGTAIVKIAVWKAN